MYCIVSAFPPELSRLIELTHAEQQENNIWISRQLNIVLGSMGVGYLDSAINLQRLLHRFSEVDKVIFTGSAGFYPGNQSVKTGDLCWCKETLLCDSAAEMKYSLYSDKLKRNPIKSTIKPKSNLYSAVVATILTLTKDDQLAVILGKQAKAELENMELYGIASVCEKISIQWNALLGITNKVGSNGSAEWRENYRRMAIISGDYLYRQLIKTHG